MKIKTPSKHSLSKGYRVLEHTYLHALFHAGAYSHIVHYGELAVLVSGFLSAAVIVYNALAVIAEA